MGTTSEIIYSSRIASIVDFVVTAVIPLFYAAKHNEFEFRKFLKEQPSRSSYLEACQRFRDLLSERSDDRREGLRHDLQRTEEKIQHVRILQSKHQQLKKNTLEINQPLFEKVRSDENGLSFVEKQTLRSFAWIEKQGQHFEETLQNLDKRKQQLNNSLDMPIDELAEFLNEIELYCINPHDNYKGLLVYLEHREEISKFFYENQELFNTICINWMAHVFEKKKPRAMQLLPSYYCPFDACDPQFTATVVYKVEKPAESDFIAVEWEQPNNHLGHYLNALKNYELPFLITRILEIQKVYFGNNQIQNSEPIPVSTNTTALFQPPPQESEVNSNIPIQYQQSNSV